MNPKEFDTTIRHIIELVLNEARSKEEAAGYSGASHDGGASVLQTQVQFYEYGRQGVIPPEWNKHAKMAKAQTDPEYQTFLRLKEKFKDV